MREKVMCHLGKLIKFLLQHIFIYLFHLCFTYLLVTSISILDCVLFLLKLWNCFFQNISCSVFILFCDWWTKLCFGKIMLCAFDGCWETFLLHISLKLTTDVARKVKFLKGLFFVILWSFIKIFVELLCIWQVWLSNHLSLNF